MTSPLTPVELVKFVAITHRLRGILLNRLVAVGKFVQVTRHLVVVVLGLTLFATTIRRVILYLLAPLSQENHTRTVVLLVCLLVQPMLAEMSLLVAKPSVVHAIQTNIAILEHAH